MQTMNDRSNLRVINAITTHFSLSCQGVSDQSLGLCD